MLALCRSTSLTDSSFPSVLLLLAVGRDLPGDRLLPPIMPRVRGIGDEVAALPILGGSSSTGVTWPE